MIDSTTTNASLIFCEGPRLKIVLIASPPERLVISNYHNSRDGNSALTHGFHFQLLVGKNISTVFINHFKGNSTATSNTG